MSELIYGRRAVLETLRAGRRHFFRLWLEGDPDPQPAPVLKEILDRTAAQGLPVRAIKGGLFDKLAQQGSHAQGVALEAGEFPYSDTDKILARARRMHEDPFLLILDHVQDPQNLGSLIRTAEAMAVHGIILPERRAAGITPAVSNASAGAVEHMQVAQVTNINRTIDDLKAKNIWIVGLDSGEDVPLLQPAAIERSLALVVGSEGAGLSHLTREKCDLRVRLPMYGQVESLNAAVAGSIVLFLARQARAQEAALG
jgi:23S rRNA (guanosine2251-2'-O)-methyltransferase